MGFWIGLLLVGLGVGVAGGMLGIGGGVIIIPTLVLLFGFNHLQAAGTSLAMFSLPIGLFAFLTYYRAGHVNLPMAGVLALGFAAGAWLGALMVGWGWIPEAVLRRLFACFMVYVAMNMLFRSDARVWAALATVVIVASATAVYMFCRLMGRQWERQSAVSVFRERAARPMAYDFEI
ncbi:MAG: sulfite exporter TauE/SafE family protein [Phycisphaeraceae bacterium]|nr:sulfite exporter TauE/SafE family protein [Phycisphaeraceae bacterium]